MNTSHETLDQYEAAYIGILLWLPVQEASRYVAAVDNADITTPALRGIHQLIAANLDAGKTAEPDSVLAAINDIEHTKHWKHQLATTLADTYTNAPKQYDYIDEAITAINDNAYRKEVQQLATRIAELADAGELPEPLHQSLYKVAQKLRPPHKRKERISAKNTDATTNNKYSQLKKKEKSFTMTNATTLSGNLTADPELRETTSGKHVVNFTLAHNIRIQNPDGTWEDGETLYQRCVAWNKLAENLSHSLAKGDSVLVTGNITPNTWTTTEGHKKEETVLRCHDIAASLKHRHITVHPKN